MATEQQPKYQGTITGVNKSGPENLAAINTVFPQEHVMNQDGTPKIRLPQSGGHNTFGGERPSRHPKAATWQTAYDRAQAAKAAAKQQQQG